MKFSLKNSTNEEYKYESSYISWWDLMVIETPDVIVIAKKEKDRK